MSGIQNLKPTSAGSALIRLKTRISPQAFEKLCARNPELRLERTRNGALEIMTPAGTGAGGRNADLLGDLIAWSRRTGLGKVFDSSAGFTLPNSAVRSPDASWIALDRWKALPIEARRAGFAAIVPDFVAELRSPTDDPRDLKRKMREYVEQGARLGWLIDPIARTAWIYRPGRDPEKLLDPATLSGEDILPGFVLDLKPIFDDE